MNFDGILIGAVSFLVIGVFHPIVIKAEYHLGTRVWPTFLLAGIVVLGFSLYLDDAVGSAILGVVGFSCLWSIKEIFEQEKRVARGWFPRNPKR